MLNLCLDYSLRVFITWKCIIASAAFHLMVKTHQVQWSRFSSGIDFGLPLSHEVQNNYLFEFASANWAFWQCSRKKDHGRAEALLLSAWALGIRVPSVVQLEYSGTDEDDSQMENNVVPTVSPSNASRALIQTLDKRKLKVCITWQLNFSLSIPRTHFCKNVGSCRYVAFEELWHLLNFRELII